MSHSPLQSTLPGNYGPRWLDRQLAARLSHYIEAAQEPVHDRGIHGQCPKGRASDQQGRDPQADPPQAELSAALALWQWNRLRATVMAAAEHSLHYRALLGGGKALALIREARTGGSDCRSAEEAKMWTRRLLSLLPFTSPHDLADTSESFLAVSHDAVEGLISLPTSGTTGKGKRIFCSQRDLEITADFFRHGMQYLVRPGNSDRVVLLMSGDRPGSVGALLMRAMCSLGVPCAVAGFVQPGASGENTMMRRLRELAPTCLVGVPAQLFSLAQQPGARDLALRCVLLSGDAVTNALRRGIERGFDCPVFVHYGLTECGLGGAVECDVRSSSHMREADLLHEIVDKNGLPLPPGEWGEIVISTLTREAMPLLRYRTGDEGRILATACPCGSVLGRLVVRDRLLRRFTLPWGEELRGVMLDERLFALAGLKGYAATVHQDEQGKPIGLVLDIFPVQGAAKDSLVSAAQRELAKLSLLQQFPVLVRSGQDIQDDPRFSQAKMRFLQSTAPFPPANNL